MSAGCWTGDCRRPVELRMNRQSKNAQQIAEKLVGHPAIERVIYPTLFRNAEQMRIYKDQCDFPGGIFSLWSSGAWKAAAFTFLRRLQIAKNAVSLGGVETLACHPKTTTHSGDSPEELARAGVTDGLVRVSVGIEHWRDLLADFEQALDAILKQRALYSRELLLSARLNCSYCAAVFLAAAFCWSRFRARPSHFTS